MVNNNFLVSKKINNKYQSFSVVAEDFDIKNLQLVQDNTEINENIIKIVNNIIFQAFFEKASDIHIEPSKKEVLVRYRVDGILHTALRLPKTMHQAIVARIKIIADLKIDEHRRPQDGRTEMENMPNASLRISTIPTLFGEKVALRILDESHSKNISIKDLGFSAKQEKIVLENIEKPYGMIIASGPTGSGKTTTLYSILKLIKKDGLNISTLEDPVEYTLEGVNQVQINPRAELSFPTGLRSLLRQDPDIIMVGEVRDSETAIMAANAALTGHLVLTTLHSNDAPYAFIRLLEMKVEDFVVASTINLIIAQRLVRKICPHCTSKEEINPVILKKIKERKDVLDALEARRPGLSKRIEKRKFKIGKGCKKCFYTGYLGRVGIYELLSPSKKTRDLVLSHESAEKIKNTIKKEGFEDMLADALDKVFSGTTTFSEILRATKNI
jgi:type IV pilus assembly protein PilB